jgi:hypothetical protein
VALRQREERRQADAVATAVRIDSVVLGALTSLHTGAAGLGSSAVNCVWAEEAIVMVVVVGCQSYCQWR